MDGGADVSGVGTTDVVVDGGVDVGDVAGKVTGGTIGFVVVTGRCAGSAAEASPDNESAAPSDSKGSTTDVDAATADGRSAETRVVPTPASLTAPLVTDSDRATVELLAAVGSTDSVVALTVPAAGLLLLTASRDV